MRKYLLAILVLLSAQSACAADKLKIVATLSSFADIAKSIGGDFVEVSSIAAPRFNPHFIEPKPSDVLKLKRADLYLQSGLDLEAWGGPLVDAAARPEIRKGGERQLDLSQGIRLLEVPNGAVSRSEGDIHLFGNPHYWLDPRNGQTIARTIAAKLSSLDHEHVAAYAENLKTFLTEMDRRIASWKSALASFKGQKLIGYHNEWIYLMDFSGLEMSRFLEPKPGIPPSPSHLSLIIEYAKREHVRGLVQATFYSTEAAESVAEKSGAKVLLLCQNVNELPEAASYGEMIDYNVKKLLEALTNG